MHFKVYKMNSYLIVMYTFSTVNSSRRIHKINERCLEKNKLSQKELQRCFKSLKSQLFKTRERAPK